MADDVLTRDCYRWPARIRALRHALLARQYNVPSSALDGMSADQLSAAWRWVGTGKRRPGWLNGFKIERAA